MNYCREIFFQLLYLKIMNNKKKAENEQIDYKNCVRMFFFNFYFRLKLIFNVHKSKRRKDNNR